MTIKKAIKTILNDYNISKYRLAKNIKVTPIMIDRYLEADTKSPNFKTAQSIYNVYNIVVEPYIESELKD